MEFRLIYLVFIFFGTPIYIGAQDPCPVGELIPAKMDGVCNGPAGDEACSLYCKERYNTTVVKSECVRTKSCGRKSECICHLQCISATCAGDPHCTSFDSKTAFGYQSQKKYYMMKPCKKYKNMPHFELRATNKPWNDGIPGVTVIDTVELIVPEWGMVVDINGPQQANGAIVVKINGKQPTVPFRYAECTDEYRESFLNVDYHPDTKAFVTVTTSFGLRVDYHAIPSGAVSYNELAVDMARHPDIKGGAMCGLFGGLNGWNDNPNDDNIDSTGKPQPLDFMWSWAFGDSWIVPGTGVYTPKCTMDMHESNHKDRMAKFDPKLKKRAEQLCRENLHDHEELVGCAKSINRQILTMDDCMTDLMFLDKEEDMRDYMKAIINRFGIHCRKPLRLKTKECTCEN